MGWINDLVTGRWDDIESMQGAVRVGFAEVGGIWKEGVG